jgi:hypothetical protein
MGIVLIGMLPALCVVPVTYIFMSKCNWSPPASPPGDGVSRGLPHGSLCQHDADAEGRM